LLTKQAAHLTVFNAHSNYSIPARNAPISAMQADWDANSSRTGAGETCCHYWSNENLALETSPEGREQEYEDDGNLAG
jgi:hypothetical protein